MVLRYSMPWRGVFVRALFRQTYSDAVSSLLLTPPRLRRERVMSPVCVRRALLCLLTIVALRFPTPRSYVIREQATGSLVEWFRTYDLGWFG